MRRLLRLANLAIVLMLIASPSLSQTDFQALDAEIASLHQARKFSEGLSLARRYLDEAKQLFGADGIETSKATYWTGVLLFAQGYPSDAEPYMQSYLELQQKRLGSEHSDVGMAALNLALVYEALRKSAEAESHFKRAIDILGASLPNDAGYATALARLAKLYSEKARIEEAESLAKRALEIFGRSSEAGHPASAVAYLTLARVYEVKGRRREAEGSYRQAISITEKDLGGDHVRVAVMRGALGGLLKAQGQLIEARLMLQSALSIMERTSRPEDLVSYLAQLADLERMEGHCDKAENLFARVRLMRSKVVSEVPVFFSTNRNRDLRHASVRFEPKRAKELSFGLAMVDVPNKNKLTQAGLPVDRGGLANVGVTDASRLAIHCIEVLNQRQFIDAVTRRLRPSRIHRNQALVYIHGYSVSFENSLRRAAQIAADIEFDGAVFAFSWPARENLTDYFTDDDTVEFTSDEFEKFVTQVIAEIKVSKVHFIAHSMGNRLLLRGLGTITKVNPRFGRMLGEVINAAPDVDRDVYVKQVKAIKPRGGNFTLYASSRDWALSVSSSFRHHERAGYFSKEPIVGPDFDTLDITQPAKHWYDWFNLNHDVYATDPVLVADLNHLVLDGARPPDKRSPHFEPVTLPAGKYWKLRPGGGQNVTTGQLSLIVLEGLGQRAYVRRTGPDSWEWRENSAVFRFRGQLNRTGDLVLHDASRNMYHYMFLGSGQTFWRIGTRGNWNFHYTIITIK